MNITSKKWCKRFLAMAEVISGYSKDESSKVGAVIVTSDGKPNSWGFNGLARGLNDNVKSRNERPEKYFWYEHAERNALYQMTRDGKDNVMFVTHSPCVDCARGIIQSEIGTVVVNKANGPNSEFGKRLGRSGEVAVEMLKEAGVDYIIV